MQEIENLGLEDVLAQRTLISITAAEKVLGGKKKAAPVLEATTERPPGSPTLAPTDDPRQTYTPPGQTFEDF